jgi:amidophosphoribosyltransferase
MCGIVGVRGHPQAAELTRLGLYSLQHRGQESAGIVVVDDAGQARSVRALGLVSDGLDHDQVGALDGTVAIGHTRYSTTGSTTIENAQPALARFRGGHIALAHNGNITNATELRIELEERGSIFSSTMDSEVLVHRLAMSTSEPPAAKLADALRGVEGAYCVLVVIGDTMLAARDPRGWRPLVLGTLDGTTIVASETCALDIMGARYDREVAPGEIVSIGSNGVHSTFPLPHQTLHRCVFEHVYFSRPDSIVFGGSVEAARRALGRRLARECPAPGAELVFSVPDSSNSAALGYADESGVPFEFALIRNHYIGRTFIEPQQSVRDFGVKLKLNAVRSLIEGKRVILIDDSIVRGTTSKKIVRMIRNAGAKEVHMRISCPPTISPCFYGVDTPSKKELIAANKTTDEIRDFIVADSLAYLSLEGLKKACGDGEKTTYCSACYTGKYPTTVDVEEILPAGAAR